jgi:hypothetical protein
MAGEIEQYVFEDADGQESTWTTFCPTKAKDYAREHGLKCIAVTYEFVDSELVWDFTQQEDPTDAVA